MTSKPESSVALAIGHSTRTIKEFVRLLQAHAVTRVVDVRTVPRSRHNPQFSFLRAKEIYRSLARYVSRNTGSRLEGF